MPSFPDLAEFDEEGQSFPLDEILVNPPGNAIGYSRLSFHPMIVGLTYFLPLSYRAAVFGFIGSGLFLVLFMIAARMAAHLAALFFGLYFLYLIAATRLRAEAGPMLIYSPDITPHRLMVDVAGARSWSAQDLTSFSYLHAFDTFDYRTVAMPQQLEALKIAESARIPPRSLSPWLLLATALAIVASFVAVLAIYYHHGASTSGGETTGGSSRGAIRSTC